MFFAPGGSHAITLADIIMAKIREHEGEKVCLIVCGANVDPATVA